MSLSHAPDDLPDAFSRPAKVVADACFEERQVLVEQEVVVRRNELHLAKDGGTSKLRLGSTHCEERCLALAIINTIVNSVLDISLVLGHQRKSIADQVDRQAKSGVWAEATESLRECERRKANATQLFY